MLDLGLQHHELGGDGPDVLIILHANGFHARVYQPLASHLSSSFRCIGIDLPGQGSSAACAALLPPDWGPQHLVQAVAAKLQQLGLRNHKSVGLFCFGHSLGGALALMLEAQLPGTFSAIFAYEPAMSTQEIRQQLLQSPATDASLALIAGRRRGRFPSRLDALQSLQLKPPFNAFCKEALSLYLEYGTRPCADGSPGVELSCSPKFEAQVFTVMNPLPAADLTKVRCPVVMAVGGDSQGLHSHLVVLGEAVQKEIQGSILKRFKSLTHLGPFEKPELVADSVLSSFRRLASKSSVLQSKL